jgi:hypothetical protein
MGRTAWRRVRREPFHKRGSGLNGDERRDCRRPPPACRQSRSHDCAAIPTPFVPVSPAAPFVRPFPPTSPSRSRSPSSSTLLPARPMTRAKQRRSKFHASRLAQRSFHAQSQMPGRSRQRARWDCSRRAAKNAKKLVADHPRLSRAVLRFCVICSASLRLGDDSPSLGIDSVVLAEDQVLRVAPTPLRGAPSATWSSTARNAQDNPWRRRTGATGGSGTGLFQDAEQRHRTQPLHADSQDSLRSSRKDAKTPRRSG